MSVDIASNELEGIDTVEGREAKIEKVRKENLAILKDPTQNTEAYYEVIAQLESLETNKNNL